MIVSRSKSRRRANPDGHFFDLWCCCCCWVPSVVSDSVRPHRWQSTRLPRPWDSPGKNTGVGCHFLLQCMKVKSEKKLLSCVWHLATPWTTAYQAPLSRDFPGKSTGVGCHCLLCFDLYLCHLLLSHWQKQVIWPGSEAMWEGTIKEHGLRGMDKLGSLLQTIYKSACHLKSYQFFQQPGLLFL